MPSNQTPNYKLSQWERADKVQMEDFNADNAKIDAALKAETDARTALAAQVAKLGNCQLYHIIYTGTSKYGQDNPNTLVFPGKPVLVIISPTSYCPPLFVALRGTTEVTPWSQDQHTSYRSTVVWGEDRITWWCVTNNGSQMNGENRKYSVVALLLKE